VENTFDKNAFDWIVYILAWLASPLFIIFYIACFFADSETSFQVVKIRNNATFLLHGENWEERRRKNLYLVIELVLFVSSLTLPILFLNKSGLDNSGNVAAIVIPLGIFFGVLTMYSFWIFCHRYEEYLESKSYEVL